tara:strand:+ start:983 stop:1192 length:210 start_codon:yes stop_codon:yes gene_type:complete
MSQQKKKPVDFHNSPELLIDKDVIKEFSLEELNEIAEMFDNINSQYRAKHSATDTSTWIHRHEVTNEED